MTDTAPESVVSRLVVEHTQDVPTYYLNHAEIAVGTHEAAIWFARLPAKPTREQIAEIQETGEFVVEPELQVLIPYSLIPGLIKALQVTQTQIETRAQEESDNASA